MSPRILLVGVNVHDQRLTVGNRVDVVFVHKVVGPFFVPCKRHGTVIAHVRMCCAVSARPALSKLLDGCVVQQLRVPLKSDAEDRQNTCGEEDQADK